MTTDEFRREYNGVPMELAEFAHLIVTYVEDNPDLKYRALNYLESLDEFEYGLQQHKVVVG